MGICKRSGYVTMCVQTNDFAIVLFWRQDVLKQTNWDMTSLDNSYQISCRHPYQGCKLQQTKASFKNRTVSYRTADSNGRVICPLFCLWNFKDILAPMWRTSGSSRQKFIDLHRLRFLPSSAHFSPPFVSIFSTPCMYRIPTIWYFYPKYFRAIKPNLLMKQIWNFDTE